MDGAVDRPTSETGAAPATGPGHLVLVVGPSGAGKDTLIAAVRARLGGDDAFVFPRRVVTRPASDDEDNVEADGAGFAGMAAAGAFALSWQAHGHSYGIPASIDAAIAAGRAVICNVSREIVGEARRRYGRVTVVEVTASPEVLRRRIAARSRASDGDPTARAGRTIAAPVTPDVVIVNDAAIEPAAARLLAAITGSLGEARS